MSKFCLHWDSKSGYYHNNPKYFDRLWANSIDSDQMPHNAASDQGLCCLQLILHVF